ncbi:MAG: hypothetical protein QG646_194 [Euryarchaeota archaeon]|nr:hypothetical protein [Euryarchaeota archaeon]
MKIEKVSKNVGYDGQKYTCLKCGVTFEREMQVRGHLGSCPGRTIAMGILPKAPAVAPAVVAPSNTTLPVADIVALAPEYQRQMIYAYQEQINNMNNRIAKMENEYVHMVAQKNSGTLGGLGAWFEANKGMILLVGGSVLLVCILRDSKCHCDCDTPQSYTRSTRNGRRDNSSINSMLGTAGTYLFKKGVDKVLK